MVKMGNSKSSWDSINRFWNIHQCNVTNTFCCWFLFGLDRHYGPSLDLIRTV
jgi:hypothetical protein